jgi:hypothetical protein
MNKIFGAILVTLLFNVSFAQNFNRPVTDEMFPYEFQLVDSTLEFYYAIGMYRLSSIPSDANYIRPKAVILDPEGYNVWYGTEPNARTMTNFKYDSVSGEFLVVERISSVGTPTVIDSNFNITNQLSVVNADYIDPHEFYQLADGNYVLFAIKDSVIDLSGYMFDGAPGDSASICYCNVLEVVDASNNLLWDWNSCEHIHPSEGYDFYGYDNGGYDYAHFNSVYEDDDGHLLVSFRHLNSVVKIDRNTGNIIWQLGGKSNDFTFTNDVGFTAQHHAERRSSGNISVLDNGNMFGPPERSRAVEYILDTTLWTATLVDEYLPSPTIYSHATGSYHRWYNSKVIDFGRVQRPDPSIVVTDELNQIQALVYFKDSIMSYRVQPFLPKFSFTRPSVSCLDSAGSSYLIAESGHSSYLWSTGETTQTIQPLIDSVYQVWVPQGIGKVSSPPVHFNNASCSPVSVNEINTSPPTLIRTVDLLGRVVGRKKSGQVYINIYSDGSVKKIIQLENL